jgi:hypothetical protein
LVSVPFIFGINNDDITLVFLLTFIVYLADLLFGGLLRRIPYLSYLTFPFFIFYDYLTFRIVYQKSALLFYTNISKWKFAISALIFFTVALIFSYLNTYKIMKWPNVFDEREYRYEMTNNEIELDYDFYKDEITKGETPIIHIQSKIIKDNYLILFVHYRIMYDELVEILPGKKEEKILSDIFQISINDSIYKDVEWYKTNNKTTTNSGLTAIIPIVYLKDGKHIMKLSCSDKAKSAEINRHGEMCSDFIIPFWKDTEVTIPK